MGRERRGSWVGDHDRALVFVTPEVWVPSVTASEVEMNPEPPPAPARSRPRRTGATSVVAASASATSKCRWYFRLLEGASTAPVPPWLWVPRSHRAGRRERDSQCSRAALGSTTGTASLELQFRGHRRPPHCRSPTAASDQQRISYVTGVDE